MSRRLLTLARVAAILAVTSVAERGILRAAVQTLAGSLAGVVVTDETSPVPVRRVLVTVSSAVLDHPRSTITDANGRFAFANLPPGRFTLKAAKAAYITSEYGAKRPGRMGTPITLGVNARAEHLKLTLVRGAVIAGTVRDARGAPATGITVTTIVANGANPDVSAVTDDRGAYRLFGLAPGEYFVVAAVRTSAGSGDIGRPTAAEVDAALTALSTRTAPGASRPAAVPAANTSAPAASPRGYTYAPIFAPGTPLASNATKVSLAPGDERSGVDIPLSFVPTASIRGVVTDAAGAVPAVSLSLTAKGPSLPLGTVPSLNPTLRPGPDGKFAYSGIPPGDYTLFVTTNSGGRSGGPPAPRMWATMDLTIAGQDVEGVALELRPALALTGRVRFDASVATPPDLASVSISVSTAGATSPRSAVQALLQTGPPSFQAAQARADGTFDAPGLLPGSYRVSATVPGGGWWLRSAMIDGQDALDHGIDVSTAVTHSEIVVTLTDRRSQLAGVLGTAAGTPAPDYFVVVFPADRQLWMPQSRRVQAVRPATDGRYVFRDLPPGEYLLAALTDVEPGDWNDSAFLGQIAPSAVRVALGEGETKTQDLRIAK